MKPEIVESYRKAGKIASEVRGFSRNFIKKNMKLLDIAEKIEEKIKELGGECAFPVNLSINEIAAHYTPGVDDKTLADGLLKVDLGVVFNGFIADTAFSIDLSENNENKKLMKLNEKVLDEVLGNLDENSKVCDVGNTISGVVRDYNENERDEKRDKKISIVKNLSGHSLGENLIHAGLTISNYKNENEMSLLGEAIAIEPFLTTGSGDIYEWGEGEIYSLKNDKPVRDSSSREILKFIKENYKTRPFCTRWLFKEGFDKINFVLENLVKQNILRRYPILIEKSKSIVSQVEHTALILEEGVEITTR